MKSLPLAMFVRNRTHPVNSIRGLLIGVMVVAVCAASIVAPTAADADVPCQHWGFHGYTQFDFPNGWKLRFFSYDIWIAEAEKTEVITIPPNGGPAGLSEIWGGTGGGGDIWMNRIIYTGGRRNDQWFNGGVTDDGFAYGIAWDAQGGSSSWRSAAPLTCRSS